MKPVTRDQILDYVTYEERRDEIRAGVLKQKEARRVHLLDVLTFLFENADTVRYQVQEMIRIERIVKEADIQHEIATYNELLGGPGELGATLLIEIDDPDARTRKLREWLRLPEHVYARMEDGSKVRARFDGRQISDAKLSSVHYIKFDVQGVVPIAIGSDLPEFSGEVPLSRETRAALWADLNG